jgi:DNA polymerase-1
VVGENLRKALDFLPLGRKLVTVRCDLELPETPHSRRARPMQREKLIELFTRYE